MSAKNGRKKLPSLVKRNTKEEIIRKESVTVNDNTWTCTVAILIEKNNESKKFIKSFEDASETGSRPVIKNITCFAIETILTKLGKIKPATRASVKKISKSESVQSEPKSKLYADEILKLILEYKKVDIALINERNMDLQTCHSQERKKLPNHSENEEIHDEPLCGPSLYIVLTGFYEPQIILELLKLHVPLEVMLSFNETRSEEPKQAKPNKNDFADAKGKLLLEGFWSGYEELVKAKENEEMMTDFILLTCDPKEQFSGRDYLKGKDFNNMVYDFVASRLYEIQVDKRRYGHFIRHMKLVKVKDVQRTSLDSLKYYRELVEPIPLEVITIDRILYSLIEAVGESQQDAVLVPELVSPSKTGESNVQIVQDTFQEQIIEETELCTNNLSEKSEHSASNIAKDITPFIVDHKNSRKLAMRNYQNYYLQFSDYYLHVLERSKCSLLWNYFPQVESKEKLFLLSHYQKIGGFMDLPDKDMLEASLHKRIFIKILLSVIDERNIDAVCGDTFDHYCSCAVGLNFCEEEDGESIDLNKVTSDNVEGIISDINYYAKYYAKETDVSTVEYEPDKREKEKSINIKEIIIKNNDDLDNLKSFLNFPELDDLIVDGLNALDDYNVLELYTKETALHLANKYSRIYDFVDYVHFSTTDCLLFVFHNGTDENGFSQKSCDYHLLTPTGYRDYHNVLSDKYRLWLQSQNKLIEHENEELLKKFKIIIGPEDEEKCCFAKIKKFGVFPIMDMMNDIKPPHQAHMPHPTLEKVKDGDGFLTGYEMNTKRLFRCWERTKTFVSESGAKLICKTNDYFDPLKQINCISFRNSLVSLFYEFYSSSKQLNRKMHLETSDGIRIVFNNKRIFKGTEKMQRDKSLDDKGIKKTAYNNGIREEKKEMKWSEDIPNSLIIVLPNGLEITPYSLDDEIVGVKQRHLGTQSQITKNVEAYRIFLKDGTVMSYMLDGTIKVHYANTTITEIKNVAPEKQFSGICGVDRNVERGNIDNGRGQKDPPQDKGQISDQENSGLSTAHQGYYVIGEHQVLSWSGRKKYYKFNFSTGNKLVHNLRVAHEQGIELFTFRTDGTKSLLNFDGELVVQYPDGTRITTIPHNYFLVLDRDSYDFDRPDIEDDVFSDDFWESIELDYLMEEPKNYVPVKYSHDRWTLLLPGNKKVYFSDKSKTDIYLGKGELTFNHELGTLHLGSINNTSNLFSTFSVNLWADEDNPVSTFSDELNVITIDRNGRFHQNDNVRKADPSYVYFQQFKMDAMAYSHLTPLLPSRDLSTSVPSGDVYADDECSSTYIIKPSKQQNDFKLLYFRRDLTGGELITDGEQNRICGGASVNSDEDLSGKNNKLSYRDNQCDVMLWDIIPLGEYGLFSGFYKVPYWNLYCFSSSHLKRNDLSKYLPANRRWLFAKSNTSQPYPPEYLFDLRKKSSEIRHSSSFRLSSEFRDSIELGVSSDIWQPRESKTLPPPSISLIDTTFLPKQQPVMIIRRTIDLKNVEGLDQILQNALALYLDYKRKIYIAILKNSVEEIKMKQNPKNVQKEYSHWKYLY